MPQSLRPGLWLADPSELIDIRAIHRHARCRRRKPMAGRDVRPGKIIEEITTMRTTALLAALTVMVALAGQSHADEIDWTKVDAALGKTASVQGNVHRYGI